MRPVAETDRRSPEPGSQKKLIVFGYDAAEAAQIRRIRSYLACHYQVQGFTMRRGNMNENFAPFWPNIHLGNVRNASFRSRAGKLIAALPTIYRNRQLLDGADAIVARNLDMLGLAAFAQMLTPNGRPMLIYECLDIHSMMTSQGLVGWLARRLERLLLRQCNLLIVSSPTFLTAYFEKEQGWGGRSAVLENKLWLEDDPPPPPRPKPSEVSRADGPIRLGWVGTLRCSWSLSILAEVARQMGPDIDIRMHGVVHTHALPDFDEVLATHENVSYAGPYNYPHDLADIYASCDVVWSQDLWQWGTNSTWLLPNRIYEASYYGCPSIAVDGTETSRRVSEGLGWVVPHPDAESLIACLNSISPSALDRARKSLLSRPEEDFRLTPHEVCTVIDAAF